MPNVLDVILASPKGASAGDIERLASVSRATINRELRRLVGLGLIVPEGNGAARVYRDADPLRAIRRYFDEPHTRRRFAKYNESLLEMEPSIDLEKFSFAKSYPPLERKDLVRFLVDFSCASSILEGGTYSILDTQALIEYGEKAAEKPIADMYLVLNHKSAFEYLYENLSLSSIFELNRRLTDDHGIPELSGAPHFLDKTRQGVVRDYEDVNIAFSSYSPPYRPGTGYVAKMLDKVLETAAAESNPIKSAFYLLTRIPYLQPFSDGNKRTSRALCNVPLLNAGLPPISFMDFGKKDYILSMLAFYELGDTGMFEYCFAAAYKRSCERLGLDKQVGLMDNADAPAMR